MAFARRDGAGRRSGRLHRFHPLEVPYIANRNRVASAVPSIFRMLLEAVEEDGKRC
jgi:hypothetical protein